MFYHHNKHEMNVSSNICIILFLHTKQFSTFNSLEKSRLWFYLDLKSCLQVKSIVLQFHLHSYFTVWIFHFIFEKISSGNPQIKFPLHPSTPHSELIFASCSRDFAMLHNKTLVVTSQNMIFAFTYFMNEEKKKYLRKKFFKAFFHSPSLAWCMTAKRGNCTETLSRDCNFSCFSHTRTGRACMDMDGGREKECTKTYTAVPTHENLWPERMSGKRRNEARAKVEVTKNENMY